MTSDLDKRALPSSAVLGVLGLMLAIGVIAGVGTAVLNTVLLVSQGGSSVTLDAALEPPLVVERGDNRWEFEEGMRSGVIGDPEAVGGLAGFSPGDIQGQVVILPGDGPTKIYTIGVILVAVVVAAGLAMLRGVVRSARDGSPFARPNIRRLRVAGLCALAVPALGNTTESVIISAADVGTAVQLDPNLVPWWPFLLLAAGAVGLAEIFRSGAELHDFEQLAI